MMVRREKDTTMGSTKTDLYITLSAVLTARTTTGAPTRTTRTPAPARVCLS
jgi:hypothetical protein